MYPSGSATALRNLVPREENAYFRSPSDGQIQVFKALFINRPTAETTQMPIKRRTDKHICPTHTLECLYQTGMKNVLLQTIAWMNLLDVE